MVPPAGGSRPPVAAAAVLTPREVVGILRRHVLLMLLFMMSGLIIAGALWYVLRKYNPKYTAQTYIKVLSPVAKDPMTIGAALANKDIQYGYRASIATLITQQSNLEKLVERDKIQQTRWFRSFGAIKDRSILRAIRKLKKNFDASPQRDGDFVLLSMTCGNGREAADIVNEMISLFLDSRGVAEKKDLTEKLKGLQNERDSVQNELNYAEQSIDDIRRATGLIDLDVRDYQDTVTLKVSNLQRDQDELVLEIKRIQGITENLKKQAEGPINEQVANQVENDPTMVILTQQQAIQEAQLAGRLAKFGENHRVVRQIREQINATEKERQNRKTVIAEQTRQSNLKDAYDFLVVQQGRLEELDARRKEAELQKESLDRARVQYKRVLSIKDERRQRLDEIKASIEKFTILLGDPETPKVQFVAPALVPLEISSPQWKVYFPGGTVLGLVCGVSLSFLIELLNDLVRTPKDVARYLQIPLLGIISDSAEDKQLKGVDLYRVVHEAPYSIISESYRHLRTNLKLSAQGQTRGVLLVSSCAAGDGKSSVATNLAAAIVSEYKKVLLVDANFRRPALDEVFAAQAGGETGRQQAGLSALLTGKCTFEQARRSAGIDGLDFIDAGQAPPNPADMLDSPPMADLISQQRANYDYIIIDGPPVLLVSDAKILARLVDGTVLVFNATVTRRGAAQRAIRELREVNATIIGGVLFAVRAMKGGYFHEQFESYRQYQKLQPVHSG